MFESLKEGHLTRLSYLIHSIIFRNPISTRDSNVDLLEDGETYFIQNMVLGQTQDAQIQNIVFNITGKLISGYTIRQITKYKKRMVFNDSDFSDMFGEKQTESLN